MTAVASLGLRNALNALYIKDNGQEGRIWYTTFSSPYCEKTLADYANQWEEHINGYNLIILALCELANMTFGIVSLLKVKRKLLMFVSS